MKCIFAATPYHFSIQYHAYAMVASHEHKTWIISIDGFPVAYRMQECPDAAGDLDLTCAVFVPCSLDRASAGRLLTAFNIAHPGVIPPHLNFQFAREHWWQRARNSLPKLARDADGTVSLPAGVPVRATSPAAPPPSRQQDVPALLSVAGLGVLAATT